MKWFRSILTMKRGTCLFVDRVSGEEVFEYYDCYGTRWLASWVWTDRIKAVHQRPEPNTK